MTGRLEQRGGIAVVTLLVLCTCTASSPTPDVTPAPSQARAALGAARDTAIEVCEPRGQREYLRRLRCPDGSAPTYTRIGSFGMRTVPRTPDEEKVAQEQALGGTPVAPGGRDYHVLDKYRVQCGEAVVELFMDMYHCDKPAPTEAPPGFSIAEL